MKKLIYSIMITSSLSLSANVFAEEIEIKKVKDAQIFASYTEELPAVLNYFTKASEEQIINFYVSHYGEIQSQELKRKRLTLKFEHKEKNIRVVISKQNKKRQVDVIVME